MPRKRNHKPARTKQTQEQKRNKDAERKRKQRARVTEEERTLQRVQAAELKRARRARLTEEERTLQRVQAAELMRARRRAQVTEEEITLKRVQDAVRKREKVSQTEEERVLQRAKDAERYIIRKGLLTKRKSTYESPKPPEGSYNNNTTEIKSSLIDSQQPLQRREQQITNLPADDSQSEETRNTLLAIQNLKIMVQSLRKATSELIKSTVKATVERVKGIPIEPSHNTVRIRRKVGLKVPGMKSFSVRLPSTARGSATNEYVCPVCPEIEGYSKLLTHIQMHTKTELEIAREKLNKEPPGRSTEFTLSLYPCELCPESFFRPYKFRKHMVDSHRDNRDLLGKYCFLCSLCDEACASQPSLTLHQRNFHGIYIKCPICNESLPTQQLFTEHIVKVHRDCSENEMCLQYSEGFVCKICGYIHPMKRRVMEHFQNTHSLRSLKCDVCDKMFASERNVLIHKRTRHGGKSFFCEKCGKNCKDKQSFERHVERHTKQNKQVFKCKECEKSFTTSNGLKCHHMSSHKTEKPFQCHICGMAFSLPSSLRLHKIKYCEKDQAEKTCSICEKVFDNLLLLSYHKNNIHKYENTEETVCNRCNKTMSNPQGLYIHNNRYHSNKIGKRNSFIGQCKVCGKEFKSVIELFGHWRIHNEEKPFKCSLCGMEFKSAPSFYQHRRIVHSVKNEMAKIILDSEMDKNLREEFRRLHPNLSSLKRAARENDIALSQAETVTGGAGTDQLAIITVAEISELNIPRVELSFNEASNFDPDILDSVPNSETIVMEKTYVDFSRANVPELSTMSTKPRGGRKQILLPIRDVEKMSDQTVSEINAIEITCNKVSTGDIPHKENPIEFPELRGENPAELDEVHEDIEFNEFDFTDDSPVTAFLDEEFSEEEFKYSIPPTERFPEDPYPKKLIITLERLKEHTCSTCDFLTYTSGSYEKHLNSRAHRMATRTANSSRFMNTNVEENSLDDDEREFSYFSDESSTPVVLSKSRQQRRLVENRIKNLRKPRVYICSFCGEKLESFTFYKTHLAFHAHERFRCAICEVKFETPDELTKHCDEIHEGKMPFQCEECPSGFVALYLLVRHKNRRHNSKDGDNGRKMQIQQRVDREKRPFCCSKCSWCFKRRDHLNRHIKRFHHQLKRLFSCKTCAQDFNTRQYLKEHHEKAHPAEKKVTYPGRRRKLKYVCKVCGSEHNDAISMKNHRKTHRSRRRIKQKLERTNPRNSKVYICSFCGETLNDSELYKSHLALHAKEMLKCAFCTSASEFHTSDELAKHCDEIHPGKIPFQCQECPSGFAQVYLLVRHKILRHSQVNYRKVKTLKPLEQQGIKIDKLVGHDPKLARPFSCSDCSRNFSKESGLNRHIKEVHQKLIRSADSRRYDLTEHICDICGKTIKRLDCFREHRKRHEGGKLIRTNREAMENNDGDLDLLLAQRKTHRDGKTGHMCDICGVTTTNLSALRKHVTRHEEGFDGVCPVCSARFLNQAALDLHIGVHDSTRRFRCDHCSYYFKYKSHLKRHILSAHENMTHACEICSKVFRRQDELRQHNRKVHLEKCSTITTLVKKHVCKRCNVEFCDSKSLTEHRKIHAGEKEFFKCPLCPNRYCHSQTALDKHLQLHDSSRPFSCNLCSLFFNHISNLVLHRKNVHEKMGIDYWSKNNALKRKAKKVSSDS